MNDVSRQPIDNTKIFFGLKIEKCYQDFWRSETVQPTFKVLNKAVNIPRLWRKTHF